MTRFVNIAGQASNTIGTGDLTLTTAVPGYNTFEKAGITNGDKVGYVIWDHFGPFGPQSREVGRGTYTNNTLSRDTVLMSTAHVSDSPPSNPDNGQLWWDTNTGTLYIYYKDDNSAQWVSGINSPNEGIYPDQTGNGGKFLCVKNGAISWVDK